MKPGYKQTEIGIIPKDWEIELLGNVASVKTGPFGSALHAEDYVLSGTPIITVEHIGESQIRHQNLPMVSKEDFKRRSMYLLQEGDIVFSRVGSVDRNSYITAYEDNWLFSGRLLRIRVSDSRCFSKFLSFYFRDTSVKSRIREIAVGQTMPSLNTRLVSNFAICLPPLVEQHRIAEALSDMDELISSLEKLIAKKKAIKQGTMQELLTGKRRLPGFSGEWKEYKLGELGTFIKGKGISREESSTGTICAVRYGELYTKHQSYVKDYYSHISKAVASKAVKVFYGDVLFAASGETKDEIGKCAAIVDRKEIFAGGDIIILRPSFPLDPVFMGALLNMPKAFAQRAEKGQGDAIVHIHIDALSNIVVDIPSFDEQAAIAAILLDADLEIGALDQKLSNYRLMKQGMMQQLLTGNIRLFEEGR